MLHNLVCIKRLDSAGPSQLQGTGVGGCQGLWGGNNGMGRGIFSGWRRCSGVSGDSWATLWLYWKSPTCTLQSGGLCGMWIIYPFNRKENKTTHSLNYQLGSRLTDKAWTRVPSSWFVPREKLENLPWKIIVTLFFQELLSSWNSAEGEKNTRNDRWYNNQNNNRICIGLCSFQGTYIR